MPYEEQGVGRKIMHVIFLVDKSSSMAPETNSNESKIGQVNHALRNEIPDLYIDMQANPAEFQNSDFRLSVITFSNDAKVELANKTPEEFKAQWTSDIEARGGTDLAAALKLLNKQLQKGMLIQGNSNQYKRPAVIILSDGQPNDNSWEKELKELMNNKFFTHASKVALAVGQDADKQVLAEVVGNIENVLEVKDVSTLAKYLRYASMSASDETGKIDLKNVADIND